MPAAIPYVFAAATTAYTSSQQKKQMKAQQGQNAGSAAYTQEMAVLAREDVNKAVPLMQNAALQGFQGALNVFGQTIPQQLAATQQGNMNAQRMILGSPQQSRNALMGISSRNTTQPASVNYNPSFAFQTAPSQEFIPGSETNPAPLPAEAPQVTEEQVRAYMRQYGLGGL